MTLPAYRPPAVDVEAADPAEAEAGAILTVDLAAVRANFRLLRDRAAPAGCAAVVKADAYGLGAARIAPALVAEGCRSFFVAHQAEARALRPLLPSAASLFVLNGVMPGTEDRAAAEAGIAPVLNSLQQAQGWADAARRLGRPLPAALHIDTGLSRLGLAVDELQTFLRDPGLRSRLDLKLLVSHLACADEPEHPANAAQLAAFAAARRSFPEIPASFANSSAIFLGAAFLFEGVRAGAALYGVNPTPGRPNPMRQAVRLQARVIQLRDVAAGNGVGYGHDFVARQPMCAATVGLGYGDGWPRNAQLAAFRGDARLPMVGRVSMDTTVLDVSRLPPDGLHPGDLVDFLGERQTSDHVAAATGTIGYEILTGFGGRILRRYADSEMGDSESAPEGAQA